MKTLFLAAVLAFAPAAACAQEAPAPPPRAATTPVAGARLHDADPAIWVARDADTTIYLFGTFHLLDGRPWFNDEVKAAFDASDELVMEAILPDDPASMAPMVMRYAIDEHGRRLSSRLTAEENADLNRALQPLGAPAGAFDRFEPWFVSMTLSASAAQQLGMDAANGPETILSAAAHARHMPIGELEGLEWQIRLLDSMPDDLQLADLRSTLREMRRAAAMLGSMLAAWSSGDVDTLAREMMEDDQSNPALRRLLLTDRNAAWARWIQERMARPGTVFIAVGAGHLAGPESVRAVLAAHGIQATRVPHIVAR